VCVLIASLPANRLRGPHRNYGNAECKKVRCSAATLGGRDCVDGDTQKTYAASVDRLSKCREAIDKSRHAKFSDTAAKPDKLFDESRMDLLVERVACEVTKKIRPILTKMALSFGMQGTGDDDDDAKSATQGMGPSNRLSAAAVPSGLSDEQMQDLGMLDGPTHDPAEESLYQLAGVDFSHTGVVASSGNGKGKNKGGVGKPKAVKELWGKEAPQQASANVSASSANENKISQNSLVMLQLVSPKDASKWIQVFRDEANRPGTTPDMSQFFSRYQNLMVKCFFVAQSPAPDGGANPLQQSHVEITAGSSITEYIDISLSGVESAREKARDNLMLVVGKLAVVEISADNFERTRQSLHRIQEDAVAQHLMAQLLKITETHIPPVIKELIEWFAIESNQHEQSEHLRLALSHISCVLQSVADGKLSLQSLGDDHTLEAMC
jgi:hypothetical protein